MSREKISSVINEGKLRRNNICVSSDLINSDNQLVMLKLNLDAYLENLLIAYDDLADDSSFNVGLKAGDTYFFPSLFAENIILNNKAAALTELRFQKLLITSVNQTIREFANIKNDELLTADIVLVFNKRPHKTGSILLKATYAIL